MDKILYMCTSGTILIAAVICFRYLFYHQVPKRFLVVLWIFALIRLLLPISIQVQRPMIHFREPAAQSHSQQADSGTSDRMNRQETSYMQSDDAGRTSVNAQKADVCKRAFAFAVWLAAASFLALKILIRHMRSRRIYSLSLPVCEEKAARWLNAHRSFRKVTLRKSELVKSPFTYGIFRPVILMPSGMEFSEEEFQCIMEHEWVHIRWWDVLVKHILYLTLCLYWFHPMVWVMAVLLNRDMETACDEEVVRKYSRSLKTAYALILIRLAEGCRDPIGPVNACFAGYSEIEERIQIIMKTKKYSRKAAALAVGMLCCVATAFTVSAQETPEEVRKVSESIETIEEDMAGDSINSNAAVRSKSKTSMEINNSAEAASGQQELSAEAATEQQELSAEAAASGQQGLSAEAAEQQELSAEAAASGQKTMSSETAASEQKALSYGGSEQIAELAEEYIGAAYRFGGTDLSSGVDSPGFVKAVYEKAGIELPGDMDGQAASGTEISLDELSAGDLIFYGATDESGRGYLAHEGIYNGRGQVIHASNMRDGVKASDLNYREISMAVRIQK